MRPSDLLDLLFPPSCGGCARRGTRWCPGCAASLRPAPQATLAGLPLLAGARLDGPFQQAIHTFKYRGRPALGSALALPLIASALKAELPLQALSFVPLHPDRARERGFNQAEELANQLGRALAIPVVAGLARVRATAPQVGLTGRQREANVAGAFRWVGPASPPTATGLIDDVCTTGATLRAAADALEAAGGSVAAFLVLAVPHTLAAPLVTWPE